jgi:hypothetical protein
MLLLNEKLLLELPNAHFIVTIRCVLAIPMLLILNLDPLVRTRFYEVTYPILGLYVTNSAFLYGAVRW